MTDYDFGLTRNSIIRKAYKKIGAIGDGDIPDEDQLRDAVEALNLIVTDLQNDSHIYLWTEKILSVPITSASESYDLDSTIIFIEKALIRDSLGEDTKIALKPWSVYQEIPDKSDTGEPLLASVSWEDSKIYLYPKPDDSYTLLCLGVQRLKDWDTAAGAGDLPPRFQRALMYLLAADLGEDYGVDTDKYEAKGYTLLGRAKRSDKHVHTNRSVKGAFRV